MCVWLVLLLDDGAEDKDDSASDSEWRGVMCACGSDKDASDESEREEVEGVEFNDGTKSPTDRESKLSCCSTVRSWATADASASWTLPRTLATGISNRTEPHVLISLVDGSDGSGATTCAALTGKAGCVVGPVRQAEKDKDGGNVKHSVNLDRNAANEDTGTLLWSAGNI